MAWSARRSLSSGLVSFERIFAIWALRWDEDMKSAMLNSSAAYMRPSGGPRSLEPETPSALDSSATMAQLDRT